MKSFTVKFENNKVNDPLGIIFYIVSGIDKFKMEHDELTIDLQSIGFVNPELVVDLAKSIIFLINQNVKVNLLVDKKNLSNKYLFDIKFIDFCNENLDAAGPLGFINRSSAMPIMKLAKERMTQYIESIKMYLGGHCDGRDYAFLGLIISELINNVYDHSKNEAYAFLQFFPKKDIVKVVISDVGVGIPYNVRAFLKDDSLEDNQCLEWAIQRQNTTKSTPRNKGLGLDNIIHAMASLNSKVKIISQGATYEMQGNKSKFSNNVIQNYVGTLVVVEIDINSLDLIADEEIDFEY